MSGYTLRNTLVRNRLSSRWRPDATAVLFGDRRVTYAQLATGVDELALGLLHRGFRRGDRLQVLLPNCVEYVELFFAVASLGGIIVPTNYLSTAREVVHVQQDSRATWIVVDERYVHNLSAIPAGAVPLSQVFGIGDCPGIEPLDSVRASASDFAADDAPDFSLMADPNDVVLLQYTSGTSGVPKAAAHTHSSLMWNMIQQVVDFGLVPEDIYVSVPALCWAAGFHDFLLPLLWVGGTVVLLPSQSLTGALIAELVESHRGTVVMMVPSVLRRFLGAGGSDGYDLSSLRLLCSGGEALPIELIQEFRAALPGVWLAQVYGMSEGPMIMTFLDDVHAIEREGSAGKSMILTDLRIVDAEDRDVAPGEVGEIVVRSPGTMLGYADAEEKNAEAFRNGWFHTGDSAFHDEDGFISIVGRSKDMYISGGLNVYPAEIERVLRLVDGVDEAAVVAVPDPSFGEVGCAFVVPAPGAVVTEEALSAGVKEHLATYKVPRHWRISQDPLPRTTSGKVQKAALLELARASVDFSPRSKG